MLPLKGTEPNPVNVTWVALLLDQVNMAMGTLVSWRGLVKLTTGLVGAAVSVIFGGEVRSLSGGLVGGV